MNVSIYSGRVCSVPQLKIIRLGDERVCVCKYVIAVFENSFDYNAESDKDAYEEGKVDFFECIAFRDAAQMINDNFVKGSKISVMGKMKNHRFEDANLTKHFTNIFLVQQAEFGDTLSAMTKMSGKKKNPELSIVSDLKELEQLFTKVCESGFLCVDENDYYNIATMNMF